jgi:hypothetical protein
MGTVLPTLAAGTKLRVHLGPCPSPGGTVIPYQTNGYADGVSGGWQALAGMSLAGSGVDVTVLQLVNGATSGKHYFIIGHPLTLSSAPNLVDFATVSDLTLDCNLSGASNSGASAFGAVRLFGNHVRVSRIKAIKWGTKASGTPCFAISVITGDRGAGLVGKGSVLTIDNPSPVECDLLMSGPLRLRYLANHCDETARAIVDC